MTSVVARAALIAAVLASPASSLAFSDNELKGIYSQMKPSIRCGMTEAYFIEKYRGCATQSAMCEASLISVTDKGTCTDSLQFRGLGGPDAGIIFNGATYPKPVPVAPSKKKPMDVDS